MGFFSRAQRPAQNEALESAVGPTSTLAGTLRSDGGVRVDGVFEGIIEVAGNVVVGPDGRVTGDITGRNITVGGVVHGNIDGTGQLQILATGQVIGDISVASVMIDEGGVFQGTSRLRGLDQPALPAPADASAEPQARTVEATARVAPGRAAGAEDEDPRRMPAAGRADGAVRGRSTGRAASAAASDVSARAADAPPTGSSAPSGEAGSTTQTEPGSTPLSGPARETAPATESASEPPAKAVAATETQPLEQPPTGAGAASAAAVGGQGDEADGPDPRTSDAAARRFDDGLDIDFGRWDIEPTIPDNTGPDGEPEKPARPAQRSRSSRRSGRR